MSSIFATFGASQSPMGWWNALAPWNMPHMCSTFDTSQPPIGWCSTLEHLQHVRHIWHVQSTDVLVEVQLITKQLTHVCDTGNIPLANVAILLLRRSRIKAPQIHSLMDVSIPSWLFREGVGWMSRARSRGWILCPENLSYFEIFFKYRWTDKSWWLLLLRTKEIPQGANEQESLFSRYIHSIHTTSDCKST